MIALVCHCARDDGLAFVPVVALIFALALYLLVVDD